MTWGWVNYDIEFIPWNKFGMARFLHKAHSPALLPGILVRCCTEGSCRRPLHCEAGYCLLDSIPSSGHRCLEAPHSPGTAWEPSWSRCRLPPPCQEDLPTRSPRRAGPPRSRSSHGHHRCFGRWGYGAEWTRFSWWRHSWSSHWSSERAGKTSSEDRRKLKLLQTYV